MARDKKNTVQEAPTDHRCSTKEAFQKLRKGQVMLLQRAVGHLDQTDTVLQWCFFIKQTQVRGQFGVWPSQTSLYL